MDTFLRVFDNGKFLDDITQDIKSNSKHAWTESSESYKSLIEKSNDVLFRRLSRMSLEISSLIKIMKREELIDLLEKIHTFSIDLFSSWEKCPLSQILNEDLLDQETRKCTPLLWKILKPLLFSITMIFKAMVLRSMLEYNESEVQALRFSIYGFPTYKAVLFTVLEKVKSDPKELENILKDLKPSSHPSKDESIEASRSIFYLLIIEQSMKELDDEIIENEILPFIYPYLKDKSDIRLFESVHVVILAIFSTKKRISTKLSPFYCDLLLQACPELLSVSQLRAAYSIVIRSLSETDDALAWVCLEKLIKAIEDLPITDNVYNDINSNIIHSINNLLKKNSHSDGNLQPTNSPFINQLIKSKNEKIIVELAALLFHRGHLLLTLIDQIKSVNLIFLKTLLLKIKDFLTNEPNSISKNAIQKALFDTLSTELDYTKKEAGVKWWLTEGVNICKL